MRFETRLIPLRPTLDFRAGRQKKVLALVLAMAMSLSLAVTAGAAFNDQDDVNYGVAVDTMVEALVEKYDGLDAETARAEAEEFVEQLRKAKLIDE